ncbi:hypothetical protein ACEPAG_2105 [Sanghuangporus baumii]
MNKKLSASQIAALTDISKTTVFRIIREFKRNGTVAAHELGFRGRPRVLDYIHTEFLFGSLSNLNDRYIDELRLLLQERWEKEVSDATIRRSLLRAGFTLKKVAVSVALLPHAVHAN